MAAFGLALTDWRAFDDSSPQGAPDLLARGAKPISPRPLHEIHDGLLQPPPKGASPIAFSRAPLTSVVQAFSYPPGVA